MLLESGLGVLSNLISYAFLRLVDTYIHIRWGHLQGVKGVYIYIYYIGDTCPVASISVSPGDKDKDMD